ncbi:hypothetical protein DN752_06550 [Echinicola strongylocentroti]|uniref:Outer membrane protein beta-barrel domain-containing protein n=2 Tax=Echinicola strongylocentroti TaxID=1795355 RepID=A0A2Z4IGW3_9BACT|nr:hypothetical protein DN752_06550 [Echinicola strongylocentroti]
MQNAFAQDISFGGRIGRFYSDWNNVSGPDFLRSESSSAESWAFEVYANRYMSKDFSCGLGLGFVSRNSMLCYEPESEGFGLGSGFSMPIWSISPMTAKEFGLSDKLGVKLGVSLPINLIEASDHKYITNPFAMVFDGETGEPFVVMEVDGGTYVERKVSVFIRPELGLFYKLGSNGKLTLDAMYGFNPGDPLVVREFKEVKYDEQVYSGFRHEYKGDYWAVTIGYEYRLFSK